MQNCSNSIANALELLQSCTKPLIPSLVHAIYWLGNQQEASNYMNQMLFQVIDTFMRNQVWIVLLLTGDIFRKVFSDSICFLH